MSKKAADLKPSLKRIDDARQQVIQQIAEERASTSPNAERIEDLRRDKDQMKRLLGHLQVPTRINIKKGYVFNMTDAVLELLRLYLQDELQTMLSGGKNASNSLYVGTQNELNVVIAEQQKRADATKAVVHEAA
jgi:hypothetical protein